VRARLAAVVAVFALCAAPGASAATPKSWPRAFRSCDALLTHARSEALRIAGAGGVPVRPAPGIPFPGLTPRGPVPAEGSEDTANGPPAAVADAPDHSTTNVQEKGVDEPDLVKSDGQRAFALAGGKLRAIDLRGVAPKVVDTLALDGNARELLLSGDRLVVFESGYAYATGGPMAVDFVPFPDPGSKLVEVDVSDPAHMRVVRTLELDGDYLSARLTGTTARVVVASYPKPVPLAEGGGSELRRRRAGIRRSRLKTWIPSYKLTSASTGESAKHSLVRCNATRRPAVFSGLGMLTVLTIDLSKSIVPVDSDGLLTDARTVYASPSSLYAASERWFDPQPEGDADPPHGTTTIHRFDTRDSDHTTFRASGNVKGHVLNQWSLSEYKGYLRVATTEEPQWWPGAAAGESESSVTVLQESGGVLSRIGAQGGLGKGQRIYAVRFIEDRGYVVTFRQVDPLYVLDLSDPAEPSVAGELEVLGFSAYLHPIGRDLLLGVGQDANDQGQLRGSQLSVFDVSDPAKPARLQHHAIGSGSSSEAEYDHHAFLWWPAASLAVIPLQIWPSKDGEEQFSGAIGFHAGAKGIDEAGRVTHPHSDQYAPPIRRAFVVGDRLFTVSDVGIRSSRLDTLGDVAFAAFE
jgi:hypothetical protein